MWTRRTLSLIIALVLALAVTSTWTVTVASPGHHHDDQHEEKKESRKSKSKAGDKRGKNAGKDRSDTTVASASVGVLGTAEAPRDIPITMTDTLRFEPGTIAVHQGETIRFLLENPTVAPHDFTLGDMDAQMHHHAAMAEGAGHAHDDADAEGMPGAVSLEPGESVEVVATFDDPGEVLIGCHVPGHWEAGMQGSVVVMPGGPPTQA